MTLDPSDPNAVRQAARAIVAQPQFASQRQSTWDRIVFYATHPLDLVGLIVNWVFSAFASGATAVVAWIITAAVVAALITFIVRMQMTTTRNNAVRIHYAPTFSGKSVKELLDEAAQLEAKQQWREAIRVRYSALVQSLGDQGIVRARPGRTTGEYAAEVARNAPAGANTFGRLTRIFEWVWYGDGTPSADDASEFRALAAEMNKSVAA